MGPISEKKAKPDFLDLDGDGDKEESMKKAAADKKKTNEESTPKYDDDPALKGKQSKLPDGLQKAIIKKKGGKVDEDLLKKGGKISKALDALEKAAQDAKISGDAARELFAKFKQEMAMSEDLDESFDSLVKKIDKQKGKSKKDAANIAGYIANIKRKGGGKGPTAKQKKRMAETILKELRGNINEEVSPQVAASKAINTLASKLNKAPEMDKLAAQVAKNPKLMAQLEKAVKDAGVNVELAEDESGLDMADMKKMALNLAKKSKSVNEKQEYLDDDDGSLDVGLGMASFVGGGSLGAAFGSAIVSAVPAVTSIFAGPALLGAAAGVGLFLLARKAYLSGQNNPIEF
jgi:hypothetical protein